MNDLGYGQCQSTVDSARTRQRILLFLKTRKSLNFRKEKLSLKTMARAAFQLLLLLGFLIFSEAQFLYEAQ
jgi:hypothetical protein